MKLTLAALLPLVVAAASATAEGFFRPTRVSYEDLMSGDHVSTKSTLAEALSTTGMISVTDIPDFQSKQEVMASLHGCAVKSKATEAHTFPDGTRRLTLATHSVPGSGGVQTVDHKSDSNHCAAFDTASMSFRRTVATATQAFADRLAEAVSLEQPQGKGEPLLSTATNYPFHTIADVVKAGEHLEHFHSYQKLQESPEETIELHTDQGLFLAFTPGRLISQDDSTKTELTSGFFIETKDGSSVEVEFTDQDDLVFILGDGVNQYVNDRLSKKPLRAVPHTLLLAPHGEAFSRVWYGRMVLPPADALHPVHDVTFGDLRQRMINASLDTTHNQDEDTLGLGCSSTKVARELSETTCQGNEIYCWHRCMDATLQQVSSEICSSRNLELSCVNPRLQISDGVPHGDFYPSCADRAIAGVESPLPTLPEYPRVEEVCTPEEYAQFADSSGYDHFHELEGNATLMWSVEDGEVNGRIAYDGLFGWLAFGFAYPMGKKNGMHNSTIIMASNGGNFSAFSGLDQSMGATIAEHVIDPTKSSFRHWSTPVSVSVPADDVSAIQRSSDLSSYQVETTDCFSAMTFKTSSIYTQSFNLTGSDELIWAANGKDYYMGYHGQARGRFAIDWPTGKVTVAKVDDDEFQPDGGDDTTSSAAMPSLSGLVVAAFISFAIW